MHDIKTLIVWILTPIFEIIFFVWNALKNSKCAVLNAFKETDPLLEVQKFCDYLDSSILDRESDQNKLLPLERCTYGNLMESLRKKPSYALIYLHDNGDNRCFNFCSSTLHHLNDDNFLGSSDCKLWACSIDSSEGRRVCQTLRARIFPFLALIGFKHHRPLILLKLPGCETGHVELRSKLLKVMNDNQIHMDEARIDKQERDAAQSIRLSQDEEYNQSLAADREKEKLKREKQEQEIKRVEEENQRRLEKEKLRNEMRSKLLPEPSDLQGDDVKILLRFANGTRLERRFSKKQPLQQLYAFACLQEACPDDFEIVATFPRRLVPCDPNSPNSIQTFEDFNFGKTETLFVNEL